VYVTLTALRWAPVGLVVPVMVLYMRDRGMSLPEIGLTTAVYTVTVMCLEIPTGTLADTIGSRTVLTIGSVCALAKFGVFLTADSVPGFAAASLLHGIDRALRSGPLEAWFVNRELTTPEPDVRGGLSAGAVAESAALGTAALLAGILPLAFWSSARLTVPIVAALACEAVHLAAVLALLPRHDRRPRTAAGARPQLREVAAGALGLAARKRDVRLLLATMAVTGLTLSSIELLWQPRLADQLGGTSATPWFGGFAAAAFLFSAAGALAAPRLAGGSAARVACAGTVAQAVALLALAAAGGVAVLGIAFAGTYLCGGIVAPLRGEMLHARIPSDTRTTMLSIDSLALMIGGLAGALVFPRIADTYSTPAAWIVAAIAVFASAAVYRRRGALSLRAVGTA
jgi:MFS family permease